VGGVDFNGLVFFSCLVTLTKFVSILPFSSPSFYLKLFFSPRCEFIVQPPPAYLKSPSYRLLSLLLVDERHKFRDSLQVRFRTLLPPLFPLRLSRRLKSENSTSLFLAFPRDRVLTHVVFLAPSASTPGNGLLLLPSILGQSLF